MSNDIVTALKGLSLVSGWARHIDRAAKSGLRLPAMRQQFPDATVHVRWQSGQHVFEIGPRVMSMQLCRLQQAHHHGSTLTCQLTASEEPRFSAHRPWAHQVLDMVVIDLHCAVIQVGSQCPPAVQAVVNSFGRGTAFGHALPLKL